VDFAENLEVCTKIREPVRRLSWSYVPPSEADAQRRWGRGLAREGRESWWSLESDLRLLRNIEVRAGERGRREMVSIGRIFEVLEGQWGELTAL